MKEKRIMDSRIRDEAVRNAMVAFYAIQEEHQFKSKEASDLLYRIHNEVMSKLFTVGYTPPELTGFMPTTVS